MSERSVDLLVAVITYRRPEALEQTIASVRGAMRSAEANGHHPRLVVIDNDPDHSAELVCRAQDDVLYTTEAQAGIPAARNAALAERRGGEGLAFIDDDEVATVDWLVDLLEELDRSSADAVFGPVLPILPESTASWIAMGGFFDRLTHCKGAVPRHPATNNVLLAPAAFAYTPTVRFDLAYSFSGGSDTDFFIRLQAAGALFSWAPTAIVHEVIPENRATLRWLWQRNVRLGNMTTRFKYAGRPPAVIILIGLLRCLFGLFSTLIDVIQPGRALTKNSTHIPKGLGMILGAIGKENLEYSRGLNV